MAKAIAEETKASSTAKEIAEDTVEGETLSKSLPQESMGLSNFIAIDTTHRLILEGHSVMPIGTIGTLGFF